MESGREILDHVTAGAIVVYLIEWMKRSGWCTWLTMDTKALNRITSGLMAAIAVLGITWQYEPTNGDLVIHGLTASAIAAALWEVAKQVCVQQVIYDGVVESRTKPTAVRPLGSIK